MSELKPHRVLSLILVKTSCIEEVCRELKDIHQSIKILKIPYISIPLKAYLNALLSSENAFHKNKNVAHKEEYEVFVRLLGDRQISRILQKIEQYSDRSCLVLSIVCNNGEVIEKLKAVFDRYRDCLCTEKISEDIIKDLFNVQNTELIDEILRNLLSISGCSPILVRE